MKSINKVYISIFIIIALSNSQRVAAQDPVFSQPYLSPVYLNPAATGAGENDLRVSMMYRRQWLTIPSDFNYSVFSVDKFFPSLKGGFGFMATDFNEGYLKRVGLYGTYSYTICSGIPNTAANEEGQTWFVTGALQFGYVQRRVDYNQLLFADQINSSGPIQGSISAADVPINNDKWYPDFSTGLYFKHAIGGPGYLLLGGSAHHINRPDESLTFTADSFRSQVPVLWNFNGAYQHEGEEWSWGVSAMVYKQGTAQSLQFGVDVKPRDYDITAGVWGHFGASLGSFSAISLNVTYTFRKSSPHKQKFILGLDQDFPIGSKSFSYTTGSTELGVIWDYNTNKNDGNNQTTDNPCKPVVNLSACPIRR